MRGKHSPALFSHICDRALKTHSSTKQLQRAVLNFKCERLNEIEVLTYKHQPLLVKDILFAVKQLADIKADIDQYPCMANASVHS